MRVTTVFNRVLGLPSTSVTDVRIEADDTLQVLAAAGIERASFVGTSRGGLIIMRLAAMRPGLIEPTEAQ